MKITDLIPKRHWATWTIGLFLFFALIIVVTVLFQGRTIDFWGIRLGPANEAQKTEQAAPNVNQKTTGDYSPAIQGVEGGVTINNDVRKNANPKDEN